MASRQSRWTDLEPSLFEGLPGYRHSTGILPSHALEREVNRQIRALVPVEQAQIQPSSIDLRLGSHAFRVPASFLPGLGRTVESRLSNLALEQIDLDEGAVLKRGEIYIIPLLESLDLRSRHLGVANPKSSTGRLDIFTRLITDHATEFDRVQPNYAGPLFAEISPRSFHIRVRKGSRLLQLRIQKGSPTPSDSALRDLHQRYNLVDVEEAHIAKQALGLSIDLRGVDGNALIGFRAKRGVATPIDLDRVGGYDPRIFWEPIYRTGPEGIVLSPDDFFILASKEAVTVPPDQAAEMIAYDTSVGEFRVHYAGFFDPGFGYFPGAQGGTRAVLEVRSHEVPFLVEDGQLIGRLVFQRLLEEPRVLYGRDIGSNYARQGLTLAKHFQPWTEKAPT